MYAIIHNEHIKGTIMPIVSVLNLKKQTNNLIYLHKFLIIKLGS